MNSARLKEIMTVQSKAGVGRLELNFETAFEVVEALEQAEQDAYGFRKGHEILNNALIKQGERLEQVEQTVARVREAIKDAPTYDPTRGFAGPPDDYPDIIDFIGNGEWSVAERVRKALDGETRV